MKKLKLTLIILFIFSTLNCLLVNTLLFSQSRHPIVAKHGMVVSSDRIASEVGMQILKNGGNAIDAAVATAFALAVTYPGAGNVGGGGFLVYYGNNGPITTIDFREKAPISATETMFLNQDGKIKNNSNHVGLLSAGVPGTVAGLEYAHKRFGKKPWSELIEPAIQLAEEGLPVSRSLHNDMRTFKNTFLKYPSSKKVFLKSDNQIYQPNEIWKQPDLAETLTRIQEYGKDGFYRGKTAQLILDFMKKNGGLITEEDLLKYKAVERPPVHGTYRGYDIYAMGPPSSGGVVLIEMLNILEGFNLKKEGLNSAQYLHLLTETMRLAYTDRARYLGDPDFNPNMPIEKLISKKYAIELHEKIDPQKTSQSDPTDVEQIHEINHTTHFSVIDKDGNCVSLTYTIESWYGSKIVVEGAGFLLNNEMGDFNPIPGHTDKNGRIGTPPNLIAPEKRMLSSMTPTIVTKDGKPVIVIGCPGGQTIITTILQIILNVIDFRMNIAEAIASRRIHHQWLPDVTYFEKGVTTKDSEKLFKEMGHKTRLSSSYGDAMGIFIDNKKHLYYGAADPRSANGAAVGY